jgi:hypothetical protein
LRLKYVTRLLEPARYPWKSVALQWFGRSAAWLAAHPEVAPREIDRWGLGLAALVSTFPIGHGAGIPSRVVAAVASFRALQPHRMGDPATASTHHVLQELLFYNRQITLRSCGWDHTEREALHNLLQVSTDLFRYPYGREAVATDCS